MTRGRGGSGAEVSVNHSNQPTTQGKKQIQLTQSIIFSYIYAYGYTIEPDENENKVPRVANRRLVSRRTERFWLTQYFSIV